jgi:hypothetical protein
MAEYCIRGETKAGRVVLVRRGFISKMAAEEYPIKASSWMRVWVEPWKSPAPAKQKRRLRLSYDQRLELCFTNIVNAALRAERCPENETQNVNSARCRALASAGRIKIEVFPRNYRVVTILTGRHAGKKTAPPPYRVARPNLVISKEGKFVFKRFEHGTRVLIHPVTRV